MAGHILPQPLLGVITPVGGAQLDEDGGVGESHVRLDNEHMKLPAGFVELFNDRFMSESGSGGEVVDILIKKGIEQLPVGANTRCVFFRNETEFLIGVDNRPHVGLARERLQNVAHGFDLAVVRLNGFDAGTRLERIGRIGDDDPVAMAVEGEALGERGAPLPSLLRGREAGGGQQNEKSGTQRFQVAAPICFS